MSVGLKEECVNYVSRSQRRVCHLRRFSQPWFFSRLTFRFDARECHGHLQGLGSTLAVTLLLTDPRLDEVVQGSLAHLSGNKQTWECLWGKNGFSSIWYTGRDNEL